MCVGSCSAHCVQAKNIELSVYSCTDNCKHCRDALAALDGDFHIFGDLSSRIPVEAWSELHSLREELESSVTADDLSAWKDACTDFLLRGVALLRARINTLPEKGFCFRHGQLCSYIPTPDPNSVWIEIAGNTCTPWSNSGQKRMWLDPHSCVALAWGFALAGPASLRWPDCIVNENVPKWEGEAFWKAISPGLTQVSMPLTPADFGLAVNRPRKFMALAKRPFETDPAILMQMILEQCEKPTGAAIYFCALGEVLSAYKTAAAESRGMVALGDDSMSPKDLLTFSLRQRAARYKDLYQSAGVPRQLALVDLSQNAEYAKPGDFKTRDLLPTLKGPCLRVSYCLCMNP